jgi:hypothetical protein
MTLSVAIFCVRCCECGFSRYLFGSSAGEGCPEQECERCSSVDRISYFMCAFDLFPTTEDEDFAEAQGLSMDCVKPQVRVLSDSSDCFSAAPEKTDGACGICLEDDGPKVALRACGHTFHGRCISKWLTECRANCPICKAEVRP